MALVNVTNIRLLNNPCPILSPFVFEISFEALAPLQHDLEWRVVYVGSSQCGSSRSSRNRSSTDETKVTKKARENGPEKTSACTPQQPQSGEENEPIQKPPQQATVEAASSPSFSEKENSSASAACSPQQSQADQKRIAAATTAEVEYTEELAEGEAGDYLLDAVLLGPVEEGVLAFEFAVNPPAYEKMDPGSVVGMQAVLVCALYKHQEFIRIGYYLNNAYSDATLRENPPDVPIYEKLVRCIVEEPRVTRFPIRWDESSALLLQQQHQQLLYEESQTQVGQEAAEDEALLQQKQQDPQKAEEKEQQESQQQSSSPEQRKKHQKPRQTEEEAQQSSPQLKKSTKESAAAEEQPQSQSKKPQDQLLACNHLTEKQEFTQQPTSEAVADQLLPLQECVESRFLSSQAQQQLVETQWTEQQHKQQQPNTTQAAVVVQQQDRRVEGPLAEVPDGPTDTRATTAAAAVACSEVAA